MHARICEVIPFDRFLMFCGQHTMGLRKSDGEYIANELLSDASSHFLGKAQEVLMVHCLPLGALLGLRSHSGEGGAKWGIARELLHPIHHPFC